MRLRMLAFAFALVGGFQNEPVTAHAVDETPAVSIYDLRQRIAQVLDAHNVPGAGIGLISNYEVEWTGGIGHANSAASEEASEDTLFRAASITKSFVGIAMLRLAEQGKLQLTDQVHDLAPSVSILNPWYETNPVLVEHLLEHTAGLDDMHFKDAFNIYDAPDYPLIGGINRGISALQLRWQPGTYFAYSNPGYGIAGYIIEQVTDKPFESYMDESLLKPLTMLNSTMQFNDGVIARLSSGHYGAGKESIASHPIYLRPSGNLVTSAADLTKFVQMLVNGGVYENTRILSLDSLVRFETSETSLAARKGLPVGYALGSYQSFDQGPARIGHGGGMRGFQSYYGYSREHGIGYVVLINSSNVGPVMNELNTLIWGYLSRDITTNEPTTVDGTAEELEAWRGYYRLNNPRREFFRFVDVISKVVNIVPTGDRLIVKPMLGAERVLLPAGSGLFRFEDEAVPSSIFIDEPGSGPVFADQQNYYVKISKASALTPIWTAVISLVLMLSSIVIAPIWAAFKSDEKTRRFKYLSYYAFPPLAVACLLFAALSVTGRGLVTLGTMNANTLAYMVFSALFAVLTLVGLIQTVRGFWRQADRGLLIYLLFVSAANLTAVAFLFHWNLLGTRLWLL